MKLHSSYCIIFENLGEKHLPNRWKGGKGGDLSNTHRISCNHCFMTIASPEGLHCAVLKRKEAKKSEK